jgi:hypothetical protein
MIKSFWHEVTVTTFRQNIPERTVQITLPTHPYRVDFNVFFCGVKKRYIVKYGKRVSKGVKANPLNVFHRDKSIWRYEIVVML